MPSSTTKFGPGTLHIGPDVTGGVDCEANIIGCRIKWNVNTEDTTTYLSGDSEPGPTTYDGELTGELHTDPLLGAASLFELSWAQAGNKLPFTFSPNSEVVEVSGEIIIHPLDLGADKWADKLQSEFTWTVVGMPADVLRTYVTAGP